MMGRSLGMSKPPPARFWGHGPNHLLIRAKNVVKTAIFNPHLTYSLHTFFGFFFTLAHQLDQVLPPWGKKSWGTPFCDSVGILSIANLDSFYLVKLKPAKLAIIRIAAGAESHRMGYLEIFCLSGVVLGPIDVPKSKKFKKRVRTIC